MADIIMCPANTSYSINSSGKFISLYEICSYFNTGTIKSAPKINVFTDFPTAPSPPSWLYFTNHCLKLQPYDPPGPTPRIPHCPSLLIFILHLTSLIQIRFTYSFGLHFPTECTFPGGQDCFVDFVTAPGTVPGLS